MTTQIKGLYTLTDNTFSPERSHLDLAKAYLEGGAKIIQLRMKSGDIQGVAKEILALKKKYDFTFIINDFVEIAKELDVDGVHIGENDLPVREVRQIIGPNMLIGYSSHSLEEALAAEEAGADYVALGAIFPTKTKGPGHPVQGLAKLRKVVDALKVPVVAIGGITRENFQEVSETGVAAIAMITGLIQACNVAEETKYFINKL